MLFSRICREDNDSQIVTLPVEDSRHRSPEKDKDTEYTYSSEIGTVKMDRPCYQNAW